MPHGPDAALQGLRQAVARLDDSPRKLLSGEGGAQAWIALSEALYWVAALDDHASKLGACYFKTRDADPVGKTVGGLVFARNIHAHELVTTGEASFQMGSPRIKLTPPGEPVPKGRGTLFSVTLIWIPLTNLPARPAVVSRKQQDPRGADPHGRDLMYRDRVAGRPLALPFVDAIAWFDRCQPDGRTI